MNAIETLPRTQYAKQYEDHVFATSDKFTSWKSFENTKSLAHRLEDFGVMKMWRSWCQAHLNFLDATVSIQGVISTCHTMVNTILSTTRRFYDKKKVSKVLFEALKLSVP